jgi:hypothetical protein
MDRSDAALETRHRRRRETATAAAMGKRVDAGTVTAGRLDRLPWTEIAATLNDRGHAIVETLMTPSECRNLAGLYDRDGGFRSRVVMERHGFGRGEYRYFAYPLPPPVEELRQGLYLRLAPIAQSWSDRLAEPLRFPPTLDGYLALCRRAGQTRPTPLLLRYGPGDYNCLHRDLYGELSFPLQAAILLSEPGQDFAGGEFVLAEQRPRAQSRVEVVGLRQGDAVIFAVNARPVDGRRGPYRVTMRHGVSRLRSGMRTTLGIIFHDAA